MSHWYGNSIYYRYAWRVCVCLFAAIFCPSVFAEGPSSTFLPTDVLPSTTSPSRTSANNFQLRLWEKLPPKFYYNASIEGTFRLETNPFQSPTKRSVLFQAIPPGSSYYQLSPQQKASLNQELATANKTDTVNRINP